MFRRHFYRTLKIFYIVIAECSNGSTIITKITQKFYFSNRIFDKLLTMDVTQNFCLLTKVEPQRCRHSLLLAVKLCSTYFFFNYEIYISNDSIK